MKLSPLQPQRYKAKSLSDLGGVEWQVPKNLYDVLAKKPHRETVGSDTATRFDYQKSYALVELINRHTANVDYSVSFEFHDDILFFDAENNPQMVEFTQVKTSSSNLPKKTHTLTSRRKDANSVLGKLITNKDGIPFGYEAVLVIVSNNPFEFTNSDISFENLDKTTKSNISTKLKAEFVGLSDQVLESLRFKVTNITLEDMDTYLKGKVVDLFEAEFGVNYTQNVPSWLRLMAGEIRRKNNYPPDKIGSGEDLIKHKCIGRSVVQSSLDHLKQDHNPPPVLDQIHSMLSNEGWDSIQLMRFSKAFPISVADYQDPTNLECRELCREIDSIIDSQNGVDDSLSEVIKIVSDALFKKTPQRPLHQSDMYLNCIITVVFYAKL